MRLADRIKRQRLYVKALGLSYLFSQQVVEPGLASARTRFGKLFFGPTTAIC